VNWRSDVSGVRNSCETARDEIRLELCDGKLAQDRPNDEITAGDYESDEERERPRRSVADGLRFRRDQRRHCCRRRPSREGQ
jgi:hypothetical protein